jgi:hypothetical protein
MALIMFFSDLAWGGQDDIAKIYKAVSERIPEELKVSPWDVKNVVEQTEEDRRANMYQNLVNLISEYTKLTYNLGPADLTWKLNKGAAAWNFDHGGQVFTNAKVDLDGDYKLFTGYQIAW